MAISRQLGDREYQKFKESSSVAGQPGIVVLNPDGSNVGGSGGGAATIADGADVTLGAIADATVAAGATGTISAKLRRLTTDLDSVKTNTGNSLTDTQLRATPVTISGTVTANQGGTWTVQPGNTANTTAWKVDGSAVTQPVSAASLPLPTGAATSAKQDTQQTALDAIKIAVEILDNVVSGSEAQVDIVSSALPTGASTLAEQQSQTASLSVMDDWDNAASDGASVSGDVAHDAVDAGEPVKIGGKARTANPTAVAANDRVDAFFDDVGRQVTFNGVPRDLLVSPTIVTISNTTETTVLAAGGSGVFHDVYGIIITNTSATATEVTFKDSTTGTSRFKISAPANDTRGITLPFIVPQATANNNWTATAADSVSSLDITVLAMKNV